MIPPLVGWLMVDFSCRYIRKAKKSFYARTKHEFTGLSWLFVRDIEGSRTSLKLMLQQQSVYNLMYNMHFAVTLHSTDVSSLTILAGPSDTGKSWAMKLVTSSIANSLSRTEDSSSDQASTVDDSSDLMIVVQDEYKGTTDGKDASSTERVKNEQSRISNGVTIRRRWNRNMRTGATEVETSIGIERTMFITGTNNPQNVPAAMRDRATVVPVVLANSLNHKSKIVEDRMANGVAAAIYKDEKVQVHLRGWQLFSKTVSSLQIHYTALDAIGGIPPMIEDCFQVYTLLKIGRFGNEKKKDTKKEGNRQTTDVVRLATAIHIRDHLSIWYAPLLLYALFVV